MVGKTRECETTLERRLEAMLELMGWQADLVRSALAEVRGQTGRGRRRGRGRPPRRT